jgi:hypothetical protein
MDRSVMVDLSKFGDVSFDAKLARDIFKVAENEEPSERELVLSRNIQKYCLMGQEQAGIEVSGVLLSEDSGRIKISGLVYAAPTGKEQGN